MVIQEGPLSKRHLNIWDGSPWQKASQLAIKEASLI